MDGPDSDYHLPHAAGRRSGWARALPFLSIGPIDGIMLDASEDPGSTSPVATPHADRQDPSSNEPTDDDDRPPSYPGREPFVEVDISAAHDVVARLGADPSHRLTDHLTRVGELTLAHLGFVGSVRVRVVCDDEMSRAHLTYKQVRGTTDVLTSDLLDGAGVASRSIDADVLVCLDEAERHATSRGITADHELALYVVHAILHCAGYDDRTPELAARMHAQEDLILSAIGLGPAYGVPTVESDRDGGAS